MTVVTNKHCEVKAKYVRGVFMMLSPKLYFNTEISTGYFFRFVMSQSVKQANTFNYFTNFFSKFERIARR